MTDPALRARAVADSLRADPPANLPPVPMMVTIGSNDAGHFVNNMAFYTGDIIRLCEVGPDAAVLDIGSGCGRLAIGFDRYLDANAEYVGFDVWSEGVAWCLSEITRRRPNFNFHTVAARDNYYYADGRSGDGNAFDLGFLPDHHFDTAFALSVFTHLTRADAEQYLRMVARVLKPGGIAYLTFFVIDDAFFRYVEETGLHRAVAEEEPGVWHAYTGQHFFAGFGRDRLETMMAAAGLAVVHSEPGLWANKPGARIYQDLFLVRSQAL